MIEIIEFVKVSPSTFEAILFSCNWYTAISTKQQFKAQSCITNIFALGVQFEMADF